MRAGLRERLARLEGRDEEGHQLARVVWLRPDGWPEDPADLEIEGRIICLPRKSVSVEAWVAECAQRFQHRDEWQGRGKEHPWYEQA
jgi:hypothetical protein